jgi:hypothetical protein
MKEVALFDEQGEPLLFGGGSSGGGASVISNVGHPGEILLSKYSRADPFPPPPLIDSDVVQLVAPTLLLVTTFGSVKRADETGVGVGDDMPQIAVTLVDSNDVEYIGVVTGGATYPTFDDPNTPDNYDWSGYYQSFGNVAWATSFNQHNIFKMPAGEYTFSVRCGSAEGGVDYMAKDIAAALVALASF